MATRQPFDNQISNRNFLEMKSTPREHKEALDRHAKLIKHLIDEGYAEDEESANNIIMGMSEQWYSIIID